MTAFTYICTVAIGHTDIITCKIIQHGIIPDLGIEAPFIFKSLETAL